MKKLIIIFCIVGMSRVTIAQTYLPLTGGTLTGTLTGTTAFFNGTAEPSFPNNPVIVVLRSTDNQTAGMGGGISFGGVFTGTSQTTFGYVGAVKENSTDGNWAGRLVFGTRTNGTGGVDMTRMIITSTGNVGIGTTDPTAKLSVNGKVQAKEVKVEAIWADFVFEPDYKLPSLKDTEKFIRINGHLPEIPSAKEVDKNGINLGEMNAKLLQKIEELTLYMIDQNKRSDKQEKLIEQQQREIDQLKSKP